MNLPKAILAKDRAYSEDDIYLLKHRQKCGSFESAISMSCGRLTMEANGRKCMEIEISDEIFLDELANVKLCK